MTGIEQIPFTEEGHKLISEELEDLKKVQRPNVIEAIAEARAHGDLKENAEYHAAREQQGFIEARIAELEDKLSRAQVIKFKEGDNIETIRFGARVTLEDEEEGVKKSYQIVGDLESDMEKAKISIQSPMAKALLGKKLDDLVEIKLPKGVKEYVVVNVEYQ